MAARPIFQNYCLLKPIVIKQTKETIQFSYLGSKKIRFGFLKLRKKNKNKNKLKKKEREKKKKKRRRPPKRKRVGTLNMISFFTWPYVVLHHLLPQTHFCEMLLFLTPFNTLQTNTIMPRCNIKLEYPSVQHSC